MENCLKTQLKSVVQNDNLDFIDALVVEMTPDSDVLVFGNYNAEEKKVTVSFLNNSEANFYNIDTQAKSKTVVAEGYGGDEQYTIKVVDVLEPVKVKIEGFYNLATFGINRWEKLPVGKLDRIAYSENPMRIRFYDTGDIYSPEYNIDALKNLRGGLRSLQCYGCTYLVGNIAEIINTNPNTKQNLKIFNIGRSSLGGDMATILGGCVSLIGIIEDGGSMTGTIESFVTAQRAAGVTSKTSMDVALNSNITFDGNACSSQQKTLSWTSNTITYDGVTINA